MGADERTLVLAGFGLWPTTFFFRMPYYAESLFVCGALAVLYGIGRGSLRRVGRLARCGILFGRFEWNQHAVPRARRLAAAAVGRHKCLQSMGLGSGSYSPRWRRKVARSYRARRRFCTAPSSNVEM